MDINNAGGSVGAKKKNRKNNSRKHRRNFKYGGADHSQTKYRAEGRREKNKARRAAKRERRLSILRNRYAVHFQDNGSKEAFIHAEGSGPSQR